MTDQLDMFAPSNSSPSQANDILRYMESGHSITPLDALHLFGCMRLGARIFELKQRGIQIITAPVYINSKHVASYRLAQ